MISVSAVGSLREEFVPGDVVVPDQIFDRTKGNNRRRKGDEKEKKRRRRRRRRAEERRRAGEGKESIGGLRDELASSDVAVPDQIFDHVRYDHKDERSAGEDKKGEEVRKEVACSPMSLPLAFGRVKVIRIQKE